MFEDLGADFHLSLDFTLVGLVALELVFGGLTLLLFKLYVVLGNLLAKGSVLLLGGLFVLSLHLHLFIEHGLHLHGLVTAFVLLPRVDFGSELGVETSLGSHLVAKSVFFSLSGTGTSNRKFIGNITDNSVLLGPSIVSLMSWSVKQSFADDVITEGTFRIVLFVLLKHLCFTIFLSDYFQVEAAVSLGFSISFLSLTKRALNLLSLFDFLLLDGLNFVVSALILIFKLGTSVDVLPQAFLMSTLVLFIFHKLALDHI